MDSVIEIVQEYFGKEIGKGSLPEDIHKGNGQGGGHHQKATHGEISKENVATLSSLFEMASQIKLIDSIVGTFFTIIHGACLPVLAVLFGNISETFITQSRGGFANFSSHQTHKNISKRYSRSSINFENAHTSTNAENGTNSSDNPLTMIADVFAYIGRALGLSSDTSAMTKDEFVDYADTFSLYFLAIGFVVLVSSFIQTICWELAGQNQIFRIRHNFVSQMLRQEISWFEKNTAGYVIAKLADDVERVREGIGHKFSTLLEYSSCFAIGAFFGLCINWKLTFIFGLSVPFIISKILYLVKLFAAKAVDRQEQYSKVGSISEDVLGSVRAVVAFGAEVKEHERYAKELKESYEKAMQNYYVIGFGTGGLYLIIFAAFAAGSLYASNQLSQQLLSTRQVYTVFSCVSIAIVALSNVLPFITEIAYAQGCSQSIMRVINNHPKMDPYGYDGRRPFKFTGQIKLNNVTFSYPSRQDATVLRDLSLTIPAGAMIAIVAASGEGKSTLVDLLLRFYDPQEGTITFDDFDLKSLNLKWLRENVGVVTSNSIFQTNTVYNNITGGRTDILKEEVIQAAKTACAHNFIMELENGYETMIGIGEELSAGQKQLLGLARVLIKKPKILILDEAFSAISETIADRVLKKLQKSSKGRTTIIVSNTVTRINSLKVIHVLKGGQIVETGNHDALMKMQSVYFQMAMIKNLLDSRNEPSVPDVYGDLDFLTEKIQSECIMAIKKRIAESKTDMDQQLEKYDEARSIIFPTLMEVLDQIGRDPLGRAYLFLGLVGCIVSGLVPPLFAHIFSQLFIIFSESGDNISIDAKFWGKAIFGLGAAAGLAFWLRAVYVSAIGESLSCFMRNDVYFSILRQPISWFDNPHHTSERLYHMLSRNAPIFKVAIGSRLGVVLSALVSLIATITVALILEWRLALVILLAVPVQLLINHYFQRYYMKSRLRMDSLMEEALSIATESAQDIKTVQMLSLQKTRVEEFANTVHDVLLFGRKQSLYIGFPTAISEAIVFVIFAAIFAVGARLIDVGAIEPIVLFKLFIILMFSSFTIAQITSFIPDYIMAKLAYANLFYLFHEMDFVPEKLDGHLPKIQGRITFENVTFSYPQRPDTPVLQGISFDLQVGGYLGVIGLNGKSTLLSLILRLYDCDSGKVCIDGIDVKKMDPEFLRENIGFVSQDPALFNRSIRENILYGYNGNLEGPELQALLEGVAETVCIHKFIEGLPNGYETEVGTHGTFLTAGERQRIAIARAVIRNPKILLFDEPTSALDPEQEMALLSAFIKHGVGKTCILISKQPKLIAMTEHVAVVGINGKLIEYGTHEELNELGGAYCDFMRGV